MGSWLDLALPTVAEMKLAILILPAVLAVLIYVVRKYSLERRNADASSIGSRLMLGLTGLVMGGAGWLFLRVTIDEPERFFYSGFVIGPMVMLAGLYALIISIFFSAKTVRGAIRHYYKYLE